MAGTKAREKAGLEKFLNQYASLDSSERTELLRKLRRIVDLYFYGEESVDIGSFNVWADHESRKLCEDLFIDLAESDSTGTIKGKIQRKNIERYRYCKEKIAENPGLYFDDEPEVPVNMFWVHHIENVVEQIYLCFGREVKNSAAGNQPVPESKEKNSAAGNQPAPKSKENIRNRPDLYKLKKGYLSEKVWKYLLNYLSVKYIAIGKAGEAQTARHRKELSALCIGDWMAWPEAFQKAAAYIREAPSAANAQPYRLEVHANTFSIRSSDRSRLDLGAALLHADLALEMPHTWTLRGSSAEPEVVCTCSN